MAIPEIAMSQTPAAHRIGPNAITRVAEVLREDYPEPEVERLFALADLAGYLAEPPQKMVDERDVTRLHGVLRTELGVEIALRLARGAGVRTGDYLLAHRIPAGVQVLLSWLPARLASRVLLGAIQRHAWTFAGSGVLGVHKAFPPRLSIAGCCICHGAQSPMPLCDFYAAAIERLFQKLVKPRARVTEITCQAIGADACTFEVLW